MIPTTGMNLSGNAVMAITNFYNINLKEVLVVHDELDLPAGKVKIKFGGGNAGHNGLKNIQKKFSNNSNFYRLRIGIGHPGKKSKIINFVLNKPSNIDQKMIDQVIDKSLNVIEIIIQNKLDIAMHQLHSFKTNN